MYYQKLADPDVWRIVLLVGRFCQEIGMKSEVCSRWSLLAHPDWRRACRRPRMGPCLPRSLPETSGRPRAGL